MFRLIHYNLNLFREASQFKVKGWEIILGIEGARTREGRWRGECKIIWKSIKVKEFI